MYVYIISFFKETSNVFSKESNRRELVNGWGEVYQQVERKYQISPCTFSSLSKMRELLQTRTLATSRL